MTQDKANNLTEYWLMLSSTFEKKQYGRIIKLFTGDYLPQLDPHASQVLMVKCLQAVSAKFKHHYSRPPHHQGPLHHDNADWDAALQSCPTFRAHIAHLMIPKHLSNIIWEALTEVPIIDAGRSRLQEVFTQPPTYDNYLNAMKSHK